MLFNSYTFFWFFAILLPVFRYVPGWRAKRSILLLASYVFYAAWHPPFIALLWVSTVIDWYAARMIHRSEHQGTRRAFLGLSLLVNLGMLGYFKYAGFFLDNTVAVAQSLGIECVPPKINIALPIGISFFTFQTLSYTFDVYRREMKPWGSFLDYALFVTFFPQLVAGPILRGKDFLPQCAGPRKATAAQLGWGFSLFIIGLFNKVVIADTLMAPITEAVFDAGAVPGAAAAWAGTCAFAVQVFCDFGGYSSCAIGLALMLGFDVPDNFRFPHAAIGFADFWRRWHITLTSWVRDYVFIPLGGSRVGSVRVLLNTMIVMLAIGLWHGAAWTYVLWGGFHGLLLVGERLLRKSPLAAWPGWQRCVPKTGLWLLTFGLYCLTIPVFRSRSINQAWATIGSLFGGHTRGAGVSLPWGQYATASAITGGMLCLHRLLGDTSLEEAARRIPRWVRVSILACLMYLTLISFTGEDRAFIYFQF